MLKAINPSTLKIGIGNWNLKLINNCFIIYYLLYYILVLPVGVHMPHQRPPGRVIYGFKMMN